MKQSIILVFIMIAATTSLVLAKPESDAKFMLERILSDTTWEWSGPREQVQFRKNGFIGHPGWEKRGLVTSWKVIDEHTVLLVITEGRNTDRYAVLVFNKDMTEYSGYDFHKTYKVKSSKQIKK